MNSKKLFIPLIFSSLFSITPAFSAAITSFKAYGQINESVINEEKRTVFAEFPYFIKNYNKKESDVSPISEDYIFNISDVVVTEIGFDTGCSAKLPESFDMARGTVLTVKTPKGSEEWTIYGGYQIPECDFSDWHTEKLPGFLTFGTKKCSEMPGTLPLCWDNGNPPFSASGSKNWPTQHITLNDGSIAAQLVTRKVVGVIASGNLFTGRTVRTMSLKQLLGFTDKDGKQLIDWGVPFEARPKGFRVKFSYEGLGDECSLYASLENRGLDDNENFVRRYVASAVYIGETDTANKTNCTTRISEPDSNGLRTLEVDFMYGKEPEGANPMPDGVTQAPADEYITHVNIVFASSAHGDFFKGVKNATLIVKDFEFIY